MLFSRIYVFVEKLQRKSAALFFQHVRLAKKFEQLLRADDMFEIIGDVVMGLVCFRMKASNEINQALLTKLGFDDCLSLNFYCQWLHATDYVSEERRLLLSSGFKVLPPLIRRQFLLFSHLIH